MSHPIDPDDLRARLSAVVPESPDASAWANVARDRAHARTRTRTGVVAALALVVLGGGVLAGQNLVGTQGDAASVAPAGEPAGAPAPATPRQAEDSGSVGDLDACTEINTIVPANLTRITGGGACVAAVTMELTADQVATLADAVRQDPSATGNDVPTSAVPLVLVDDRGSRLNGSWADGRYYYPDPDTGVIQTVTPPAGLAESIDARIS